MTKIRIIIIKILLISFYNNFSQDKPNIVWLVCEDQSLFFSFYGDSSAKTPNLNKLAKESTIYDNFFAVSPVCAPSRSSIITGMYPTTIGTQNMRAYQRNKNINNKTNLPIYSAVPKRKVQFFTEILRSNGYYCTNNYKEDYNMEMSPLAWDESSKNAHWRNRRNNQPFFSVFNFNITHESRIWSNHKNYDTSSLMNINLPPIFPESKTIKRDFLKNYKNIEQLDIQIGEILNQLKEDSLYERTIIFFYSDHGGPFPRYKRSIYDTGLKCPLIIKWNNSQITKRNNQMISFIDLAPTMLDICKENISESIEGSSFYNKKGRDYIYAATDRFDEFTDKRRCIRSNQFKLILNGDTNSSIMKPVSYRQNMRTMKVLDSLNDINQLNKAMINWYKNSKSKYELYNVINDPYELNNLYKNKDYDSVFNDLKKKLNNWIDDSDYGNKEEADLIKEIWPNGKKPELKEPKILKQGKSFKIISNNENSSLGWRDSTIKNWRIYLENETIYPKSNFEIIEFSPGLGSLKKLYRL